MIRVVFLVGGFLLGSWFLHEYYVIEKQDVQNVEGPRLLLSPLIASGDIKSAKKQALVGSPFNRKFEKSYSGYITINTTCNSNLFFWFFLSKNEPSADPVILFLEGGPGYSSTAAVFEGSGPFLVFENTHFLDDNPYPSNEARNVIYVDSPVGTGFSFTDNSTCYAQTLQDVSEALYGFLTQFYELFNEYKSNPLYLSGIDYSAKDVLLLARLIHERNATSSLGLNLQGLILGSPLIDPPSQIDRSEFLYELGFIDRNDRDYLKKDAKRVKEEWSNNLRKDRDPYAFQSHLKIISGITGGVSHFNYIKDEDDLQPPKAYLDLFKEPYIRRALHVGNVEFSETNSKVMSALRWTLMEDVKIHMEFVLEHYRVLVYLGQLDAMVPYSGIETCLYGLNWTSAEVYRAPRRVLISFSTIQFFLKGYDGDLCECMVIKAGHYVYKDNPEFVQQLVYLFTRID